MSYSQNNEEEVILRFFEGRHGNLLDIGAYDGIQLSNTRALIERGWSGTLVEPAPHNVVQLMKNCRNFPEVKIIQAAVADVSGMQQLYVDETPNREWSTTINYDLAFKIGSVMAPSPVSLFVPVIDIHALEPFGPFQFINIDAEWEDMGILEQLYISPIVSHCELICIEPNGLPQREVMKQRLVEIGFPIIHETLENILAGRKL